MTNKTFCESLNQILTFINLLHQTEAKKQLVGAEMERSEEKPMK